MQPSQKRDTYLLDDETSNAIFREQILSKEFGEVRPVSNPVAYFVGAQPGSGKSLVQTQIRLKLESEHGSGSVMEIVGDDFRQYHPEYKSLKGEYGEQAAFFV